MSTGLKVVGEQKEVRYVVVLKQEEYSTKYTEIPLHYTPSEELVKQLLDLSGYNYAKVTKVVESTVEYEYGESVVQKGFRDWYTSQMLNPFEGQWVVVKDTNVDIATADPKSVAKAINSMVFNNINKRGDKF